MFVSASQALDMLSAHAPRAWAKRVLCWQVYVGQLVLYFATGTLIEQRYAFHFLREAGGDERHWSVERLTEEFGEDVARSVQEAAPHGLVNIRTDNWLREPREFPIETILHAENVDWEAGTARVSFHDNIAPSVDEYDYLNPEQEGDYIDAALSDMCFELETIEMLAPNAELPKTDLFSLETAVKSSSRTAGPGRRREYDWEGALFHLIGEAEKNSIAPDPDAHGGTGGGGIQPAKQRSVAGH